MFSIRFAHLFWRALLVLPLLLLAGPAAGHGTTTANPVTRPSSAQSAAYVPGQVIVRLAAGTSVATLDAARAAFGFSQIGQLIAGSGQYLLKGAAAQLDVPAAAARLAALPGVVSASPDYLLHANRVPNDTLYEKSQWYMGIVHAPEAWDITTGSPDMIIAGIDTGVSEDHPDLRNKLLPGYNAITGDGHFDDDQGHGTFTASLYAAESNNGQGIAGVCWACKILPVKILNNQGGGSVSSFAIGIHWAVDHGARVINISAGVDFPVDSMEEAVNYANSKNVVVVASAGNTPDGKPRYPAGYLHSIAIGATARNDTTTGFSSYGAYVDLSAPGVGILGATLTPGGDNTYDFGNGTSFSAPLVAGAAALILSINPGLNPDQVQAVLEAGADDIESPGWDDLSGWGRLNIAKSLQIVQSGNIPALPVVPGGNATPTPGPVSSGGATIRGKVTGVQPSEVLVSLSPANAAVQPRTTGVGADGTYAFDNLPAGTYSIGLLLQGGRTAPAPVTVQLDGQGGTVREVNFNLSGGSNPSGSRPAAFDRVAAPGAGFQGTYFNATGHTLSGAFLTYWQANGGLPIFGYPLSEPYQETNATDGKLYTVQYFERNRFELHPEFASTPNEVLLGLLGRTVAAGRNFAAGTSGAQDATHIFFTATQHSLNGAFLAYWQQHGGLAIFGYPISEPIQEANPIDGKLYTVQYFERNRFELHPEFAGTPNEVQLGLLGVEVLRAKGWR